MRKRLLLSGVILFCCGLARSDDWKRSLDDVPGLMKQANEISHLDLDRYEDSYWWSNWATRKHNHGIDLMNAAATTIERAYQDANAKKVPVDLRAVRGEDAFLNIAANREPTNRMRGRAIYDLSRFPSSEGVPLLLDIAKGEKGHGQNEWDRASALESLTQKSIMGFAERQPIIDVCLSLINAGKPLLAGLKNHKPAKLNRDDIITIRLAGTGYEILAKLGEPSTLKEILDSKQYFAGDIDPRTSLSILTSQFADSLKAQKRFLPMSDYQEAMKVLEGYDINPPRSVFDVTPKPTEAEYLADLKHEIETVRENLKASLAPPTETKSPRRSSSKTH